jgi:ATP-dependent RNA circularization protein (DNA/RNA ligase family)
MWERVIQSEEFEGIEYVSSQSNGAAMELGTILYNQKNHLILQMYVLGFSPIPVDSDFFTL